MKKIFLPLLALLVAVQFVQGADRIPYLDEKNKLAFVDFGQVAKDMSVSLKRRRLVKSLESSGVFLAPLCDAQDKPFEPQASLVNPKHNYWYVRVFFAKKTYPILMCAETSYAQLKELVIARFKTLGVDESLKAAADIKFDGVVDEKSPVNVKYMNAIPANAVVPLNQGTPLVIIKSGAALRKPPKMDQLTGESLSIDIPEKGVREIENIRRNMTVEEFRTMMEVCIGADGNHHRTLAVCIDVPAKQGQEAGEKDVLTNVFSNTTNIPTLSVEVFDWTDGGKEKKRKFSYCQHSTVLQVLKRALPAWKSSLAADRLPRLYVVGKDDHEAANDGVITMTPVLYDENFQTVAQKADKSKSKLYVAWEDSVVFAIGKKKFYLPEGEDTLIGDIREAYGKAVDSATKSWQYAFCDAVGNEVDSGQSLGFLDPANNKASLFKKDKADTSVLLLLSGKESRSLLLSTCKNTTFEQLASRMNNLRSMSPNDIIHFSYLNKAVATGGQPKQSDFVKIPKNSLVSAINAQTPPIHILATVNMETPITYSLDPSWVDQFLPSSKIKVFLEGLQVGTSVDNVDSKMTIGSYRKMLIAKAHHEIDAALIESYPMCVPAGGQDASLEGFEMDDNHTFAHYGLTAGNFSFRYEKASLVDWTESSLSAPSPKDIGVCSKSTYGQIVSRVCKEDAKGSLSDGSLRIIVQDEKIDKQPIRTFEASPSTLVHDKVYEKDKDKRSVVFLIPKEASMVMVDKEAISIGDPNTTPTGVLRDYFVNKDKEKAHLRAFCADMKLMFWKQEELDENRSFASYGYVPNRWTVMEEPKKVKVQIVKDGTPGEIVDMQYCPRSTVADIKYRALRFAKADMSSSANVSSEIHDQPSFWLWSAWGDAENFIPAKLFVRIDSVPVLEPPEFLPTEKQLKQDVVSVKEPVDNAEADKKPTVSTEQKQTIDKPREKTKEEQFKDILADLSADPGSDPSVVHLMRPVVVTSQ